MTLGLIVMLPALLGAGRAKPANVSMVEEYFTVVVPGEASIKKATPAEDFDRFDVELDGHVIASVYVGNQPTFPRGRYGPSATVAVSHAHGARIFSVRMHGKLIGREILIERDTDGGEWPRFIHAWIADDIPPAKVVGADRIVMSIRSTRPK